MRQPRLDAELAETNENLVRANLTPAQEALAVSRRKEIYELLHPETKHGGDRVSESAREKQSDNLSFCSNTAEATGKDKRTIERAAARGEALGDDLKAVEGTSLDKGVKLDALARKPAPSVGRMMERASECDNALSYRDPSAKSAEAEAQALFKNELS